MYEISHGTEKSSDEAIIFYGACFILFRFFDIAKPFPVNFFDNKFKKASFFYFLQASQELQQNFEKG